MKRTIFFAAFLAALFLAGCGTVVDKLTPRFYDVTQQDDSTRLYPGSIELAGVPVLVVSRANAVPGWDVRMDVPPRKVRNVRPVGGFSAYDIQPNKNYLNGFVFPREITTEYYYWSLYMQGGFFDRIVSFRTGDSFRRMAVATLVECDSTRIGPQEAGLLNREANARLVVALRRVDFYYDRTNGGTFSGSNGAQPVDYESVWDLYWMDGERVEQHRAVRQRGAYWITSGRGEALEGVLACALKVSDDFVSLFRQTQTRPRRK